MNKKIKAVIALLMSATMLFAFAACGGKDDTAETTTVSDETTTEAIAADATTSETLTDETTAPADDATTVDETTAVDATTAVGETTVAGETTTAATTTAPKTTAEVIAYFNTAANAVKTDKPGYTKKTNNVIGNITSSNGVITSLAQKIVPMFPTENDPVTVAKGASHNDFPVAGKSWASKLDASSVKSATCKQNGKFYEIDIRFKDESLNDLPTNPQATKHGTAMTVLSAPEVYEQTDKIPSFLVSIKSFAPTYSGSYITCKINAATGKMVSAVYYFSTIASVGAKVVGGSLTATVPFAIKDNFTINY